MAVVVEVETQQKILVFIIYSFSLRQTYGLENFEVLPILRESTYTNSMVMLSSAIYVQYIL